MELFNRVVNGSACGNFLLGGAIGAQGVRDCCEDFVHIMAYKSSKSDAFERGPEPLSSGCRKKPSQGGRCSLAATGTSRSSAGATGNSDVASGRPTVIGPASR